MLRSGRSKYLRSASVLLHLPTYARLVWGLTRDPRTPLALKALLAAALAYVAVPIDVIPDVVPIIGAADDLTVLLLVLDLFINNAPAAVRDEHLARASRGEGVLDADLARARDLLGHRYAVIRDGLPELLQRFAGLNDPDQVKRLIGEWRTERGAPDSTAGHADRAPDDRQGDVA